MPDIIKAMFSEIKWKWFELKRLYRLYVEPEQSIKLFIKTVGAFWLWRHGIRREYKVRLWRTKSHGWYAIDMAQPNLLKNGGRGIEVKGGYKKYYGDDVARDQKLGDRGWEIKRVTEAEMTQDPKKVRQEVRQFFS